jgi:hypothetical protein
MFPSLRKLRLNNSIIPSVRDLGCTLGCLTFLSLARCNLTSLDGIATISQNLEELYLACNRLTDVCDLMGMEKLKFVDLEDNLLSDVREIQVLSFCPGLTALTLAGNPAAAAPDYRLRVNEVLPQLVYLDEKRVAQKARKSPRPPPIPRSATSEDLAEDSDAILTQQIDDIVGARPPSSRGNYEEFAFPELGKVNGGHRALPPRSPRIFRPVSGKGKPAGAQKME